MTRYFGAAMRRATAATRKFNLISATRIIQRALGNASTAAGVAPFIVAPDQHVQKAAQRPPANQETANQETANQETANQEIPKQETAKRVVAKTPRRFVRPLGEVVETLAKAADMRPPVAARTTARATPQTARKAKLSLPEGASFTLRNFACSAGTRAYKLYVPSRPKRPKGLIVMLHGCTQDPDDFAIGTGMNAHAEVHGLLVAYPGQTRASNTSSCWNWFESGHQQRGEGEPAILAEMARALAAEHQIDPDQIYVAGLSAGAAMAVIMGQTYPDVFTAVGAHSGLAYQSAGNVVTALAVMRGSAATRLFPRRPSEDTSARGVRTIIFHGSADKTVHPCNAELVVDGSSAHGRPSEPAVDRLEVNGRMCARTVIKDQRGAPLIENWLIEGAGHAWSGGQRGGSYTDPLGPDASREMIRFFLNTA